MAAPKKIVVMMDKEKSTKNKQRFEERDRKKKSHVDFIYAHKENLFKALGEPDSLKVTFEVGD